MPEYITNGIEISSDDSDIEDSNKNIFLEKHKKFFRFGKGGFSSSLLKQTIFFIKKEFFKLGATKFYFPKYKKFSRVSFFIF